MGKSNSPRFDKSFIEYVEGLYEKYLPLTEGCTTDILPQLQKADPNNFAIAAVSVDGASFAVGDHRILFPMQSISKPFVYGLALEDRGEEYVRRMVGVEPTGDAFNSMIRHQQVCEGRFNPMVNVGAVTTTSMIKGGSLGERIGRISDLFAAYVDHPIDVDETALQTRRSLDNLNRALAYLMVSEGCIENSVEDTVDLYAHQCSISVNCGDLALMAATLANGGVHPISGRRLIAARYVKNILSIMFSSGLYEYSGQWAYRVGTPAKSGLAGAILAVVPGRMGLAVYSPLLGSRHKSIRGVRVLEDISRKYDYHVFSRPHRSLLSEKAAAVISRKEEFASLLEDIHSKYRNLDAGEIYRSEEGLHDINKDHFAICAVSIDGAVHETGDSDKDFLIQSVSKLFAYGLALEDHGSAEVLKMVDVEPTGDAYNAIIKVDTASKRPHNPMVNTGGIAVTSLIEGEGPAKKLNRILEMYKRYTGRRVFIDTPAYISEQTANDRNMAISYLLRNFGMIEGDLQQTLDLYLQQCSAIINCRDLAMMGATLANGGVNPVTGVRALKEEYVRDLLTVMYTCGMYDFAGEWAYGIGLPAKSGVSGCILAVVPGQMGIAVFSPPLDQRGNSARGIKVFEELSERLRLHIFHSHWQSPLRQGTL